MKRTLKLHAIPLSDMNGGRAFTFTATDLQDLVRRTNQRFRPANIEFEFDPATDWEPRRNTSLNSLKNSGSKWWQVGNSIASKYPGKVVVFFRHGPGENPTGNGHAYPPATGESVPKSAPLPTSNVNYVAMPNTKGGIDQSDSFFAHELGHYLGLFHTFPGWGHTTVFGNDYKSLTAQQAQERLVSYIRSNGGNESAMNGDLLSDTSNDPGRFIYTAKGWDRCSMTRATFTLSGSLSGKPYSYTFRPPRRNVMTYGACGRIQVFSPQQIDRMHRTLIHESRRTLVVPPCYPDFHGLRAGIFQTCFDYWIHRGLWPFTLCASRIGSRLYVAGSFQKGKNRPVRHLVSGPTYQKAFNTFKKQGFRPGRVTVLQTIAGPRFTVVWAPIDGSFKARHGMTLSAFNSMWHDMRKRDYLNTDLFIYPTGASLRAAAVWVKKPFKEYATYFRMTSAQYNQRFKDFWKKGLRVTCFVAYKTSSGYRYAAIWEKLPGVWAHYYGMTSSEYQKKYSEFAKKGLRIHQIQAYGNRYSAIWSKP